MPPPKKPRRMPKAKPKAKKQSRPKKLGPKRKQAPRPKKPKGEKPLTPQPRAPRPPPMDKRPTPSPLPRAPTPLPMETQPKAQRTMPEETHIIMPAAKGPLTEPPKGARPVTPPPTGTPPARRAGPSATRKMERRKFLFKVGAGATGAAGILTGGWWIRKHLKHFERKKREIINAEHGRLTRAGFGNPEHRLEWSYISVAMRKAVGDEMKQAPTEYRERKLMEYLMSLEGMRKKTTGLTPIDVVRTIRVTPPTRGEASRIRTNIEQQRRYLKKIEEYPDHQDPKYQKEWERIDAKIARLETVAAICETASKLPNIVEINSVINHIPKDVLDDILLDRRANKL